MELSKKIRDIFARIVPWKLRKSFPEVVFKHLYPQGVFDAKYMGKTLIKLYSSGAQVENEIYWRGIENCHEKLSVKIWIALCEILNPKVVWDVGANTGTYGVIAKYFAPQSDVSVFEPLQVAIEIAQKNFQINNYDGNFHQLALGNFSGKGKVFLESNVNFAYSVTVNKNLSQKVGMRELSIQVEEARAFIHSASEFPDLVKIDVETFEPEVLEGFRDLDLSGTTFLIEILNDLIAKKVERILPPKDFFYFNIDDSLDTCLFQENLTKSDFYNFLILPKKLNLSKLQTAREFLSQYQKHN